MNQPRFTKPIDARPSPAKDALEVSFSRQVDEGTPPETVSSPSELIFFQMVNVASMMVLEVERRATIIPNSAIKLLVKLIMLAHRGLKTDMTTPRQATSQRDRQQHAIAVTGRYIDENLANDISLAEAAATACLSPNYLSRLLKRELGRGFTDIVTERRLQLYCELIATTNLKIIAISRQCGFADDTYFARRFRQWYGCSPGQWRVKHASLLEPCSSKPSRP